MEPGRPFAGRERGLMGLKLKHIHPCASGKPSTPQPWLHGFSSISPWDFITASNDAVIACVGQQAWSLICISQGLSSAQAARVCTGLSTTGIQSWLASAVTALIQVIINNNVRLEIIFLGSVHGWSFSMVCNESTGWEVLLHPILGVTLSLLLAKSLFNFHSWCWFSTDNSIFSLPLILFTDIKDTAQLYSPRSLWSASSGLAWYIISAFLSYLGFIWYLTSHLVPQTPGE